MSDARKMDIVDLDNENKGYRLTPEGASHPIMRILEDISQVRAFWESGDYLAVKDRCDHLKKRFGDRPQALTIKDYLADLRSVRDVREILRAQEKVRKLIPTKRIKSDKRRKLIKELNEIVAEFPDTMVERDALDAIAKLSGL